MTPEEFIQSVTVASTTASAQSKLPVGDRIAQAAIETAWGARIINNNYFGLTCKGDDASVPTQTHECLTDAQLAEELKSGRIIQVIGTGSAMANSSKKQYMVLRNFGSWSSIASNFEARDNVLITEPVYADARAKLASGDIEGYITAYSAHWATDPNYAKNIISICNAHGLFNL